MPIYPTAQLAALVEVAAAGSFTRAAERLGVSQPTVSGAVRALEQRVGTPLLVRAPRSVRLTAAGRALLPHAERALVLAAEAETALDRAVAGDRLRLWVSGGEALATYVLPPAIAELRKRLPSLDVGFVVGDEARVLSALRSGEVDAALLTARTDPGDLDVCALRPRPHGAHRGAGRHASRPGAAHGPPPPRAGHARSGHHQPAGARPPAHRRRRRAGGAPRGVQPRGGEELRRGGARDRDRARDRRRARAARPAGCGRSASTGRCSSGTSSWPGGAASSPVRPSRRSSPSSVGPSD